MISPFPDLSTTPTALKIRRLPHGGYLVSKVGSQAYTKDELFACTDIDDALAFIKDELGEPEAKGEPEEFTTAHRKEILTNIEHEKWDKAEARIEAARHGGAAVGTAVGHFAGFQGIV